MTQTSTLATSNHYSVLGLPLPVEKEPGYFSKDVIKAAYHRALLKHHPDKQQTSKLACDSKFTKYDKFSSNAINEIIEAYQVLREPKTRKEYDEELRKSQVPGGSRSRMNSPHRMDHLGIEELDLEDLTYDSITDQWFRGCRCGAERGYVITTTDLEMALPERQVLVECDGCSLYVKIAFEVEEGA